MGLGCLLNSSSPAHQGHPRYIRLTRGCRKSLTMEPEPYRARAAAWSDVGMPSLSLLRTQLHALPSRIDSCGCERPVAPLTHI